MYVLESTSEKTFPVIWAALIFADDKGYMMGILSDG